MKQHLQILDAVEMMGGGLTDLRVVRDHIYVLCLILRRLQRYSSLTFDVIARIQFLQQTELRPSRMKLVTTRNTCRNSFRETTSLSIYDAT